MDWLNIHSSTLDSDAFLGADPVARGTWLCLLRYCCGQENGGTIHGAGSWGDRKWQQICRVTQKEVLATSDLWAWTGKDLVLAFYPHAKQTEIQSKRKAGKDTVAKRWHKQPCSANSSAINSANGSADTEGKGRERKGREGASPASATDQGDITGAADETTEAPIEVALSPFVIWHGRDEKRTTENLFTIQAAEKIVGRALLLKFAEQAAADKSDKVYPEALMRSALAWQAKNKPAQAAPPQDPIALAALAKVRHLMRDNPTVDCPALMRSAGVRIADASEMERAAFANPPLAATLEKLLKGAP